MRLLIYWSTQTPPAVTEHYDGLFDAVPDAELVYSLTGTDNAWTVRSLLIASNPLLGTNRDLSETPATSTIPVVMADFPTEEDALNNLQNTLDSSRSPYYKYSLEEGGLKLPLSW